MSRPSPRLIDLLPALLRARDQSTLLPGGLPAGAPLSRLLSALDQQLHQLQAAIDGLEDNLFPERASAEALRLLAEQYGALLFSQDLRNNRGVVAKNIHWQRRKGSPGCLEEVLDVTTGWGVEVDEAYRSLNQTQDLSAPLPERGRTWDISDPITMADPLSRRMAAAAARWTRITELGSADLESTLVDLLMEHLGDEDAAQPATAPRNLDLDDWARPDVILVRTARLQAVEREDQPTGPLYQHRYADDRTGLAFHLDPDEQPAPLSWQAPVGREQVPELHTDRHEPAPPTAPAARAATVLLSTTLAADPAGVEAAGALELSVDHIPLVGPSEPPPAPLPIDAAPPVALLRFAAQLPSSDRWRLELCCDGQVLVRAEEGANPEAAQVVTVSVVAPASGTVRAVGFRIGSTVEAGEDLIELDLDDETTVVLKAPIDGRVVGRPVQPGDGFLNNAELLRLAPIPHGLLELRVERLAGAGAQRAVDGSWSSFVAGNSLGTPLSPVVHWERNGNVGLVRAVHIGARVALEELPEAGGVWTEVATGTLPASWVRGTGIAVSDGLLWLFGPEEPGLDPSQKLLGCRTVAVDGTVAIPTIGGNRRPPALTDSSVVAHGDGIWIYGGYRGDQPSSELWFLDLSGPPIWRARTTRGTPARVGAQLLPTAAGLLLIGGSLGGEALENEVLRLETRGSRTVWRSLPALPLSAGLPGSAVAWEDGAIKLLLWADRHRPSLYHLGDVAWERVGEEAEAACRPPAPGECLVHGGILTVCGPPPLPPSEVILQNGDSPMIGFLPALDLPVGDHRQFQLLADGSSQELFAPGRLPPVWVRPGAPLFPAAERSAPAWRLGVPGRLSWTPYRLRQIHLGRWSEPLAPLAEDEIGLDPRLGRVILPPGAPVRAQSRLRASWWEGRPERIGVGCMPADRRLPACWEDPEVEAWTAPDLAGALVDGWVDPEAQSLPELLGQLREKEAPILAIVDSPSLPPARLSLPPGGLTLASSDPAAMPRFEQDEGCLSLSFHPSSVDDAPALWLAGLRTVGRLDLHMQRGTVELRWCSLGMPTPGAGGAVPGTRLTPAVGDVPNAPAILAGLGLRVVGGGHQDQTALRSLPASTLELRLHGCQVGAIEIPPWATLVATGCTFDAGDNNAVAIRAAGARVRLRHCTIRGRTEAGILSASSTLFTGRVRVDQTSSGWLRYSVLPSGGSLPSRFRCRTENVAISGDQPLRPDYLLPSSSNPPEFWEAGEAGRCPGAYAERSDRDRELTLRSAEFVPVGTTPLQKDRVPVDLARIRRRPA